MTKTTTTAQNIMLKRSNCFSATIPFASNVVCGRSVLQPENKNYIIKRDKTDIKKEKVRRFK